MMLDYIPTNLTAFAVSSAPFRYVLSIGAVFALYSFRSTWQPKIVGVDYNKPWGKATSRYPWLIPQFYYDMLQTYLMRGFNSLEWGLDSPPKPHAFVSLPIQSELTSLIFHSTVLSSVSVISTIFSSVTSNLFNPINLCVSIFLVSLIILCCTGTDAESSQAHITDTTLKPDFKGKKKEDDPVTDVDIGSLETKSVKGLPIRPVFDRFDKTAGN